MSLRRVCRCGHGKDAHAHYRRGADCSACACEHFHAHLEIVVRLSRSAPAAVVLPDEVHAPEAPYVRPTHSVGLGLVASAPVDLSPLLRHHIARPREGSQPIPPPVRVAPQRRA